jgi:hypothetical protein
MTVRVASSTSTAWWHRFRHPQRRSLGAPARERGLPCQVGRVRYEPNPSRLPLRSYPRVTAPPDGPQATRQARNLLMDLGDHAADFRFPVRDRRAIRRLLRRSPCPRRHPGREDPPASPPANAFAERFVLTTRRRSPTGCSSSASGTRGRFWPSIKPTTTDDAPPQPPAALTPPRPPRN